MYDGPKILPHERNRFWVQSEKNPKKLYFVDMGKENGGCDCPNWQIVRRKEGQICKHQRWVLEWLGWQVVQNLREQDKKI